MNQPKLFTTAEMERAWAINDVVETYKAELTWEAKNGKTHNNFSLRDPSNLHVTNRNLRNFHAMYPVSLHRTLIPSERKKDFYL